MLILCKIFQVQRQLQLRIEAQGKYLKKIIEEQQRLSGVLTGSSASDLVSGNLDSDKIDPPTPVPTSELPPLQEKCLNDNPPVKSFSLEELSSPHEPLTPDSGCNVSSPLSNPRYERSTKKQRVSLDAPFPMPYLEPSHLILESSLSTSHQHPSLSDFPSGSSFGTNNNHQE